MQELAHGRESSPGPLATDVEPTLGDLLRSVAAERTPRQWIEAVAVALPWAQYFASIGMWRASMATGALGCLGLWAVCDRFAQRARAGWRRTTAIVGRKAAAVAAVCLAAALVLDLCFLLMGSGRVY